MIGVVHSRIFRCGMLMPGPDEYVLRSVRLLQFTKLAGLHRGCAAYTVDSTLAGGSVKYV